VLVCLLLIAPRRARLQLLENVTRHQLGEHLADILPPIQAALCDADGAVREAAGAAFGVLFKGGAHGAVESVVPSLLTNLDSPGHAQQSLEGLRVILSVRPQVGAAGSCRGAAGDGPAGHAHLLCVFTVNSSRWPSILQVVLLCVCSPWTPAGMVWWPGQAVPIVPLTSPDVLLRQAGLLQVQGLLPAVLCNHHHGGLLAAP